MPDSVPALARSVFVQRCTEQTALQVNLCIFFSISFILLKVVGANHDHGTITLQMKA